MQLAGDEGLVIDAEETTGEDDSSSRRVQMFAQLWLTREARGASFKLSVQGSLLKWYKQVKAVLGLRKEMY